MISISNSVPNEVLYHYCPSDSFYGIVSSKALWLSNSEYANDPNENKIGYNILNEIANDSTANEISRFAKIVLEYEFDLIDTMSCYVFCMSEKQ